MLTHTCHICHGAARDPHRGVRPNERRLWRPLAQLFIVVQWISKARVFNTRDWKGKVLWCVCTAQCSAVQCRPELHCTVNTSVIYALVLDSVLHSCTACSIDRCVRRVRLDWADSVELTHPPLLALAWRYWAVAHRNEQLAVHTTRARVRTPRVLSIETPLAAWRLTISRDTL